MADAVQLASAVVSLAEVTCLAVQLVRKLYKAQKGAKDLCQKVERLAVVVDNVKHYVESEPNTRVDRSMSTRETNIKQSVLVSIKECEGYLTRLNTTLAPLLQDDRAVTVLARLRFALMENTIKRLEGNIEAQFQSLTLSLLTLNGLNNNASHCATHESQQMVLDILQTFVCLITNQRPSAVGVVARSDPGATSGTNQQATQRPLLLEGNINDNVDAEQLVAASLVTSTQSTQLSQSSTVRETDEISIQEAFGDADASRATVDSPLATAVKTNKGSVVSSLVESSADITERDIDGWTLLHHAVFEKATGPFQVLLSTSIGQSLEFINAQNNYGQTALMLAAEQAASTTSYKMAEKLLATNCDVNATDKNDRTALYVVIEQTWEVNRDKFARLLLEKGADAEVVRPLQNSKKHTATREVLYGAQRRDSMLSSTG